MVNGYWDFQGVWVEPETPLRAVRRLIDGHFEGEMWINDHYEDHSLRPDIERAELHQQTDGLLASVFGESEINL